MKCSRLLALLMAVMLVFSLAACDNSKDTSMSVTLADDDVQSDLDIQDPVVENEKFESVEAFLSDPDTKEALAVSLTELADEMFSVDVKGTDDSLVYTFTFAEGVLDELDESDVVQSLNDGLEENSAVFSGIAGALSEVVSANNPKVVVIYARPDGTNLVERVFDSSTTLTVEDGSITIETAPEN